MHFYLSAIFSYQISQSEWYYHLLIQIQVLLVGIHDVLPSVKHIHFLQILCNLFLKLSCTTTAYATYKEGFIEWNFTIWRNNPAKTVLFLDLRCWCKFEVSNIWVCARSDKFLEYEKFMSSWSACFIGRKHIISKKYFGLLGYLDLSLTVVILISHLH